MHDLHGYEAYCFDEAVAGFGTFVTGELERIDGKSSKEIEVKRHMRLTTLLGLHGQTGRFKDPMSLGKKKS